MIKIRSIKEGLMKIMQKFTHSKSAKKNNDLLLLHTLVPKLHLFLYPIK